MNVPLSISGLRKSYRRLEVLRGLSLEVPRGSVYGLVGLNGSGKTTTLECCLGLLRPDGGNLSILGRSPRHLYTTGGDLGVVFDSPCLHPNLTVRQVLRHAAAVCGSRSTSPGELEELLGLERYSGFRIRKLSLGNRRRASIAHALVGQPSFLILDEPFSGLDAGGVDDVLALVARLNRERGTTFLLSSHQLAYLERVCSHMAILHDGRIARCGSVEDLLAGRTARLWLRVDDGLRACDLLRGREGLRSVDLLADGRVTVVLDGDGAATVNRALVEAGIGVSELVSRPPSLEALFRDTVGGGNG